MSNSQGPGGGALEPPYSGGFGPPPTGKHPYSPTTTSSSLTPTNGLSDLTSSAAHHPHHPHLTLLKTSSSNNHGIGLPPSWGLTGMDTDGLGPPFTEMRYLELNQWDLTGGYPSSEGLTARLVDNRSIDSPDQPINYRPWEKPDSSSNGNGPVTTTASSPSSGTNTNTNSSNTTTNGPSSSHGVSTTGSPNGAVSSTNGGRENENKSPPTLTPLTNAFPTFTEAFVPVVPTNGQKLPSFQSQFNSFNDPPISGHIAHPLAMEAAAAAGLPSFHTLPANGRYVPTHTTTAGQLHPAGVHPSHSAHIVAASPMSSSREQQPFLEERQIHFFPGQVPLATGQFSQLIATSSPATSTMTITNGHHIHSPHPYHPTTAVMTNGNGTSNGGSFNGNGTTTVVTAPGTTTLQLQELVPVPPIHTILHPTSAAAAVAAVAANSSSSTHKLAQTITTDGSIPGLNLNIIEPHHHHPHHPHTPHHPHAQHASPHHHFATQNGNNHISLNLPKYLSNNDGSIGTHLIAVKLNGGYEDATHHAGMLATQPQQVTQHPQTGHLQLHHPHPITKLEHHQRSPQIITNGVVTNGVSPAPVSNNNNNGRTNGTPSTPKRQGKRKRASENPNNQNEIINNNNGHLHNNHHHSPNNAHQVSSVSSTESSFKRPNLGHNGTNGKINGNGLSNGNMSDGGDGIDKPSKKKRKRCGECIGCQRKDNCGECAPCRNDKSHQICKQRRCDKLTEKKTPKSKLKQQQQQQQQQAQQQLPQLH